MAAEHVPDLGHGGRDDRLLGLRAFRIDHRFADDSEPDAFQGPRFRPRHGMAGIGRIEHRRARHGGVDVARVVIAVLRVLQRVEHFRAVAERAAQDTGAVAVDVGADGAAVKADHRLVRQDQRDRIMVRRPARRGARLLAEAGHDEVGGNRHGRARARAERGGARRVVDVDRVAAPARSLVAERRGQHPVGLVAAARVASAAVIFGQHRLGEDDRALVAQLPDQHMVARREIHLVGGVGAAGRAHVLRVERILEREDDAVHRHRLEVGIGAVLGIELGGALQRVGLLEEHLADRRRAGRQRPLRRMAVERALAGHRALATNVDRRQRVDLAGIRDAGDHAELLLHARVRRGRLHAAIFERRSLVPVEVGQHVRDLDRPGREGQRRAAAHRAGRRRHRQAVLGDQHAGRAVIGAHPVDIALDDLDQRDLAGADRGVHVVDRRFFEHERCVGGPVGHGLPLFLIRSCRRREYR